MIVCVHKSFQLEFTAILLFKETQFLASSCTRKYVNGICSLALLAGAPQALLQSCLTFGAFSFIIEGLNKQQPALAHPFSARMKSERREIRPPMALPLQFPLPNELKEAFSSFCKSLQKRNKGAFPTAF